ncbi:hypothetical protein B484DRAFT_417683 [Ochromonadaceae sp. CCMP2298]|nr:hypothetical protein B484DRAFT_449909 [Ochromonadaceae sp. CCMP2298]KAJ1433824.1 hypothetical protein B484DRAFT_417683 [Ochromonadaceae sp. CCMP2298]|mmetsp:Transcript_17089/g.37980  ORF Transcript_17089/g.37980 Transcript_17089/m.37980 type:complete len:190 (-) Transcript_17089:151-720(-)
MEAKGGGECKSEFKGETFAEAKQQSKSDGPVSRIDCSKVMVIDGAYAACSISRGDIVEYGIIRRLKNVDGDENPFVFSWSEDGTVWATGSGCSSFYTPSQRPNTKMVRYFDQDRFEIFAERDILIDEKLTQAFGSNHIAATSAMSSHKGRKASIVVIAAAEAVAAAAAAAGIVQWAAATPQSGEEVRWC